MELEDAIGGVEPTLGDLDYDVTNDTSLPKTKREIVATQTDLKRKLCEFDLDIIECPICYQRYSSHVYQCRNGHAVCAECCEKLNRSECPMCKLATGRIRCRAIEQIMESLRLSCKYADYGCEEMLRSTEIDDHEENECNFEPYDCPVPECEYEGSRVTLPVHLIEEHGVKTAQLDTALAGAVSFRMESDDRYVLVEGDESQPTLQYLVSRQSREGHGDAIFCSRLRGAVWRYNLNVVSRSPCCAACGLPCRVRYCMTSARAKDLRRSGQYWDGDVLLVPDKDPLGKRFHKDIDVQFSLFTSVAPPLDQGSM